MRKFVLVLVCTLILTVFIAFNYLLWDREKKIESINVLNINKNTTIEALSGQIKNLDQANNELRQKLQESEEQVENLKTSIYSLNNEIIDLKKENDYKDNLIRKLREIVDLQPLKDRIVFWADAVNEGDYAKAYSFLTGPIKSRKPYSNLQEFASDFRTAIKSINVESIELYEGARFNSDQSDFVFNVGLSVVLVEGQAKGEFSEGLNQKLFTVAYVAEMDDWVICDITGQP